MSRSATPCQGGSVKVIAWPFQVEGKTRLRFCYHTPTGKFREMELEVDVRDVLCIANTIRDMRARYKQLAQELANEL